jgi:uncharacterized protein YggE
MVMMVAAAFLIMLGMLGSAFLLSQANFAPNVNVNNAPTNPNVYVSSVPPEHAVSVSATSSVKMAPDLLMMQIRVSTEAQNARQSQEDNAVVSADLRSKLKALGLTDDEIQTSSYSVDPVYRTDYNCDKNGQNCHYDSTLTGYRTSHTFALNVKDLTKGGDIIDAASTAGTNQTFVDSVSFGLQDTTRREVEKSLLKNASIEAKDKAGMIADGSGATLGKVLYASESYVYYPTPVYKNMAAEAAAPTAVPTQISPGQVEVSATVGVSYEIK